MKRRIILTATLVVGGVSAWAAPAFAHVTIDPPSVPKGSTIKLSFEIPNEQDGASTTDVQIFFPVPPDQSPIPGVAVAPHPGWTYKVTKLKLTKPITTDDGTIAEIVSEIEWKADGAATAIKPGEFGEFTIDADGIPDDTSELSFKAIQTYSNGDVVRWIQSEAPGGEAPEHPTPILKLTDAGGAAAPTTTPKSTGTATASTSAKDNSARALGAIAIVLGGVALLGAVGALRKRTT